MISDLSFCHIYSNTITLTIDTSDISVNSAKLFMIADHKSLKHTSFLMAEKIANYPQGRNNLLTIIKQHFITI